ncbi:MAG: efflux RND transporter periplasmic adaptor subunit [Halieaceae bacterium]|nr:efflux RND transporter periplasmic adaptor subunit [Halieaceae bacterium]
MRPGSSILIISSVLALLLAGCGGGPEVELPSPSRPVKLFTVEGGETGTLRSFPGRIDAAQRAELSFRVPGKVQAILVREGTQVEKGQVLARLDPADYELALEDRQASFDRTQRNFTRARDLVADGNISQMDFDRIEAEFRSASAALSRAKNDLEYTVLQAPFAGRIAAREVEAFEEVTAKQTIFWLQNHDQFDVSIDVPESVVRSLRTRVGNKDISESLEAARRPIRATAHFDDHPDETFELVPKEISTKADPQTQTYRATFTMDSPFNFNVLPGMTATVELDLGMLRGSESIKWVPVRAVQADSALQPRVWVLDPQSMTVSSREVAIGRMSSDLIEVTSGLTGGEEIVAVGAPYLSEGMKVTRMKVAEQAVPRASDPS